MTTTGRDNKGRYTRTLEGAERDREAARLRSRGFSYQEISDDLGYGDRANAYRAVTKLLAGIDIDTREIATKLQLDQLDMLTQATLDVLERFHYTVSDGRIVYLGDKGDSDREPLLDDGPVLNAVDRLLKIADRRARLLGLDAPKRVEVSDSMPDLDAAVRELAAELEARGEGHEVPAE